jgi:hypothetical protein
MNPVGGTLAEHHLADQELESFVTATLSQLVYIEGELLSTSSSLKLMIKVNVSVMHSPNGQLEYFINKIEHSVGVELFSTRNSRWTLWLADEFTCMFSRWMADICITMKHLVEPEI